MNMHIPFSLYIYIGDGETILFGMKVIQNKQTNAGTLSLYSGYGVGIRSARVDMMIT